MEHFGLLIDEFYLNDEVMFTRVQPYNLCRNTTTYLQGLYTAITNMEMINHAGVETNYTQEYPVTFGKQMRL